MFRVIVFAAFFLASAGAYAANATLSLSEHSALMKFNLWVGGQSFGRSEAGIGLLYNDEDSYLAEANFHVIDEAGSKAPGLMLGVGGKFYGVNTSTVGVMALGVGGTVRYNIPKADRVFIGADLYAAPPIVTFIDGEWLWETAANVGYEILPQADVYVGYREYGIEKSSGGVVTVDSGFRFGLKMRF